MADYLSLATNLELGDKLISAPKNLLVRIVELGFLPTDNAELRLKKVALTLVPLIIGPLAFVWGSIYILLGHFLSGSIPMSYSIISAVGLSYFFKTQRTRFIYKPGWTEGWHRKQEAGTGSLNSSGAIEFEPSHPLRTFAC
jgi:hypothetical protein